MASVAKFDPFRLEWMPRRLGQQHETSEFIPMPTGYRRRSLRSARLAPILLVMAMSGCTAGSLLVTPVSAKRKLVETELSRDSLFALTKIAMIDVTGVIANAPRRQLLGGGEHPVSLLLEQLDRARRDPWVKAVVLRLNSPGGTVVASELIHDEITRFRKSGKPIVAVMMDVAASGAYYIACACDEIIAQPSTITGSIGVIMQMFDVSGTMNLIGVKTDAIISGPFKDSGSPFRAMKPEDREIFQGIVDDMYERFVSVIERGRPALDEAAVRRLADGRVYTAQQALDEGLIDRIATLRVAIDLVKERIGAKHVRLVTYHRPLEYRPNYYALGHTRLGGNINLLNIEFASDLIPATPRFMYLWAPAR